MAFGFPCEKLKPDKVIMCFKFKNKTNKKKRTQRSFLKIDVNSRLHLKLLKAFQFTFPSAPVYFGPLYNMTGFKQQMSQSDWLRIMALTLIGCVISHITSLCLSDLICQMGMMILSPQGCWEGFGVKQTWLESWLLSFSGLRSWKV